jgi:predicted acyl esterase
MRRCSRPTRLKQPAPLTRCVHSVPLLAVLMVSMAIVWCASTASAAGPPSEPRHGIEVREVFITLPDGVRLAADLHMPTAGAADERFPVLLEYLPYRKDEARGASYGTFSYFVKRGYVVARVDIRGTGRSEGRLVDHEYTEQEQLDGETVIDWLSRQPFSNGNVGMFGISWGGFNSIHMAMRRPPALKAIIAIMATDDIYEDDAHFIDGMMHIDSYEVGQDVHNILPGAPDYRIDEQYFRDRFDTTPWLLVYKRQQRDGPFWDRASLNRDYGLIDIPTFVIGGYYDGYRDSVPRMLEHVKAPVKGMMGPWNHTWPNEAVPPPAMEWRHEAVRWFDQWLKGRDTGIMQEPAFSVYVRDWHPPGVSPENIPGRWRYEPGWPTPRVKPRTLFLGPDHGLKDAIAYDGVHHLRYVPTVGVEASGNVMWWGDWAPDQSAADTFSLVYESEPLSEDLEILGLPRAQLAVSADAPLAYWLARLSDVAPDGRATQVAGAGFNGANRESASRPQPLEPGRRYELDIEMHFTSWVFPKGHRIRLAVNNAQWPMAWPTPHPMTTSLHLGSAVGSRLVLPVAGRAEGPAPAFLPPEANEILPGYRSLESETVSGYAEISTILRDQRSQTTTVTATNSGAEEMPWGIQRYEEKIVHEARDLEPARASTRTRYAIGIEQKERHLTWEGVMDFSSDAQNFYYDYTRRLLEGDKVLREKSWKETIPRDFH